MSKLIKIKDYKGYAIFIWEVTTGWMKGVKYYSLGGAAEYRTIEVVKLRVDRY